MGLVRTRENFCVNQPEILSKRSTAGLDTEYYACSYDCIIKEGGAIATRTLWIVHSHYRGTVKSKYVDIAISFS